MYFAPYPRTIEHLTHVNARHSTQGDRKCHYYDNSFLTETHHLELLISQERLSGGLRSYVRTCYTHPLLRAAASFDLSHV